MTWTPPTVGRTPLTRRRAPRARKVKTRPAPTAKACQTRGRPAARRLRDWPCEKQDRGGFWVDGGALRLKTREGASSARRDRLTTANVAPCDRSPRRFDSGVGIAHHWRLFRATRRGCPVALVMGFARLRRPRRDRGEQVLHGQQAPTRRDLEAILGRRAPRRGTEPEARSLDRHDQAVARSARCQ